MNRIGAIIGTMILRKRTRPLAPSTFAASRISVETEVMPASRMIAANGNPRQTLTAMIEMIARLGSPSQLGLSAFGSTWIACPIQLTMLYWESNIHFQVIELSAIG